jgi:hypothetical protein
MVCQTVVMERCFALRSRCSAAGDGVDRLQVNLAGLVLIEARDDMPSAAQTL